jgi:hypothetical protein
VAFLKELTPLESQYVIDDEELLVTRLSNILISTSSAWSPRMPSIEYG